MRALLGVVLAIPLVLGCGKKKESEPAAAAGSGSAAAPAAPVAPVDAAAPPKDDFATHFEAGEALEDQKKYSDALVEFEAALKAKPDDARTLNEVGFNATFAGKLDRAKEAGIAAIAAAKDDKVLHAQALFNLGIAVEKAQPYAAAQLYTASLAERPNKAVSSKLAKLMKVKAASEQDKDALALLSQVKVTPAAKPAAPGSSSATPEDQALMTALEQAGVEWENGAGKAVLLVTNVECVENHQTKKPTFECTRPAAKGAVAEAVVKQLVDRKVSPSKEHGDVVTYKAAQIRCRSFDEGDDGPDVCEVTP